MIKKTTSGVIQHHEYEGDLHVYIGIRNQDGLITIRFINAFTGLPLLQCCKSTMTGFKFDEITSNAASPEHVFTILRNFLLKDSQ